MKKIAFYDELKITCEICETLLIAGFEPVVFKEPEDLPAIIRSNNDIYFIMSVNFYEEVHSVACEFNMPYVAWTFDSGEMTFISKILSKNLRENDFLFFFNRKDYEGCISRHPNTWFLPFSASKSFEREPLKSGLVFDVLSIMNIHGGVIPTNELFFESVFKVVDDPIQKKNIELIKMLMDLMLERHKNIIDKNRMTEFIKEYIQQCGVNPFNSYNIFLKQQYPIFEKYGQILSCIQRALCVIALCESGAKVDVYGNEPWENVLASFPNATYHAYAEYLQLPELYNQAKININLTQIQNLDALPQRMYHVLASGGFLLTNYFEEIESLFKPGVHLETFRDFDEMKSKVEYYLKHEDERLKIACAGHEEFMAKHTMISRLSFILEKIADKIPA